MSWAFDKYMFIKRGLDKKGDVTISTVILIVLGLAVLVFMVIGFTKGFDVFFGNLETVDPGKLEVIAQACKGYASAELRVAYCEFREAGKEGSAKLYINCKYEDVQKVLRADGVPDLDACADSERRFCQNYAGERSKVKVNDLLCTQIAGVGTCTGTTPKACTEYSSADLVVTGKGQAACESAGCTWNIAPSTCTGTNPKPCLQLGEQACINAGPACTWAPTPIA